LLDMIARSSRDMLLLLDDLLDVSAIESGRVAIEKLEVDLAGLLREQVKFHRLSAEKKSMELLELIPAEALVNVDPKRIKQVIDNLISNAVKYSPLNSEITIKLVPQENSWLMSVCDLGPGIPEGDIPKLFQSFQRLNSKATAGEASSGLGLAICKRMVDAHQGVITYKDNDGGGSCFSVSLPA